MSITVFHLEQAQNAVGLHLQNKKTEYMPYNQPDGDLFTLEGNKLKQVDNLNTKDLEYNLNEKDIEIRNAQAWSARNNMDKVWNANP